MLVNCQCIEALVVMKWQIIEKGSKSADLQCFREHFGVPPKMVACLFNCITTKNATGEICQEDILWA